MKYAQMYVLDLIRMAGNGKFPCPKCGVVISPDDETDEVYSILEVKVEKENLEELVIQCNRCSSHIHLTGFSIFQKLQLLNPCYS
jgi:ribosomal protein S27AE